VTVLLWSWLALVRRASHRNLRQPSGEQLGSGRGELHIGAGFSVFLGATGRREVSPPVHARRVFIIGSIKQKDRPKAVSLSIK
jgi:hypothetical protein